VLRWNILNKTTLYYIPIEPLKERYTEEWYKYMPKEFTKEGFNVIGIDGITLSNFVETGTFLDINSTLHYKTSQLQKISRLFHNGIIQDGDIFFVADLEFWGIESIRYLADLQHIRVFIYGFLHAGSYTREDYMEKCTKYAKYFEIGWLSICDKVFVGSYYHKMAIMSRRVEPYCVDENDVIEIFEKIKVTGNPMFEEAYTDTLENTTLIKRKQIIISNRFDWEKRPNISLDFAYLLKKKYGNTINIIVTTSRLHFTSNRSWLMEYARELEKDGVIQIYENLSKADYHHMLKESKVMLTNSIEENFGYCIAEACLFNTAPLCKNDYSHPELVNNNPLLLFDNEDEILEKIDILLKTDFSITSYATYYFKSMERIMNVIKARYDE